MTARPPRTAGSWRTRPDPFPSSARKIPNASQGSPTRTYRGGPARSGNQPQAPYEVSWFSALYDDDYEFLGVSDPLLKSSWEHCRDIVLQADALGFDKILLPLAPRYRRTVEAMHILKTLLRGHALDFNGEFWKLELEPPRIGTVCGNAPLLYFGGMSPDAREAAAVGSDVFLMWPTSKTQSKP